MRAKAVNESLDSEDIIDQLKKENAILTQTIKDLQETIEFFQDTEAHGNIEDWRESRNYGLRGDMDTRSWEDPDDWRSNEMGS